MSGLTKTIDSDDFAQIQSSVPKCFSARISQRCYSSSNTIQLIQEETNLNSVFSIDNNSNTQSVLNVSSSSDSYRNVEYDICPVLPCQNLNSQQLEIVSKLQLDNIFMYISQPIFQNSLQLTNSGNQTAQQELVNNNGLNFILEDEKENKKTLTNYGLNLFNSQYGLKCTQVSINKKNNIIQVSFVQNALLSPEKQDLQLQMQENSQPPQINQQMNQYQESLSNVNSIYQFSEIQFEASSQFQSIKSKSEQKKGCLDKESSKQLIKTFGINFEKILPQQQFTFQNTKKQNSQPEIKFKNMIEIENWVKLRISSKLDLQKNNQKQFRKGGSNYYIFNFDQKYQLVRQLLDQQFVHLIQSNIDEIAYSYLHSEIIESGISLKIKQHMQNTTEQILLNSQNLCIDSNSLNIFSYSDEQIKSFSLQTLKQIFQKERSIFLNENLHFINPSYVANIYCQETNQIIKKQVIPQYIVLEQSYFIQIEQKQQGDKKKQSKSSIIKLYSNSIKKSVSYRSYINHQYLEQSIKFQEKFYQVQTAWKRRGKNQKTKSKYNTDEDLSSLMTN